MSEKHTKGPWYVEPNRDDEGQALGFYVVHEKTECDATAICFCNNSIIRDREQEANAKLIAAAPEMLKALEGVMWLVQSELGELDEITRRCWEAISKAKGN